MFFSQNNPKVGWYFLYVKQGEVIKASIDAILIKIARITSGDLSLRHCFCSNLVEFFNNEIA